MRVVLLGPQGVGKGTQAQRLSAATGAPHISTGDLVRAEIKNGTALGATIRAYNDRGDLVPDDIIIAMAMPYLNNPKGWILDGFPRTIPQAQALDNALADARTAVDAAIVFEAPDDRLIERLSGRRQSKVTGKTYHIAFDPPPPDDPGPFLQRDDDQPDKIRQRLDLYHKETEPLKTYYGERGLLLTVEALDGIDAVAKKVIAVLQARFPHAAPSPSNSTP